MLRFQKAWKAYFWFSVAVLLAGVALDFTTEAAARSFTDTASDIASYVLEIISLISLYCFAWQVRFGNRTFWVVFFFVLAGFFGYTIGYEMFSDIDELVESGYFVLFLVTIMFLLLAPQFVASYLYAFRSGHLWAKAP